MSVDSEPSADVVAFLAALPLDRRADFKRVRDVVKQNLPTGYEEVAGRRMLMYQVPLSRHPDTYNGQPLWYAALASEKTTLTLHLMPIYGMPEQAQRVTDAFKAAGKKLNMGKGCIRFRKADDLELAVIAEVVASCPVDRWIEIAQWARKR
jgi:hypothetical protein